MGFIHETDDFYNDAQVSSVERKVKDKLYSLNKSYKTFKALAKMIMSSNDIKDEQGELKKMLKEYKGRLKHLERTYKIAPNDAFILKIREDTKKLNMRDNIRAFMNLNNANELVSNDA